MRGSERLEAIDRVVSDAFRRADQNSGLLFARAPGGRLSLPERRPPRDPEAAIRAIAVGLEREVAEALAGLTVLEQEGADLLLLANFIAGAADRLPVGLGDPALINAALALRGHSTAASVAGEMRDLVSPTLEGVRARLAPDGHAARTRSAARVTAANILYRGGVAYRLERLERLGLALVERRKRRHAERWSRPKKVAA